MCYILYLIIVKVLYLTQMCIRIPGYLSYYRSNYCDLKACFPSQTKKKRYCIMTILTLYITCKLFLVKILKFFILLTLISHYCDCITIWPYFTLRLFICQIFYFLFFLSCNIGLIYPKILQYLVFISVSDKLTSQLATVLLTTLKREILIAYDEKNRAVCMLCWWWNLHHIV